ncbi:MAG TPA: class I adenylate-forming enzyme family protein [Methylophilaceae bacterium]|nr:class I adenylate-forming enzyme family protein [Methylophilaceae bacterium]
MLLDLKVGNLTEPVSGRSWDGKEIRREVARRIARFQRHGLASGDRVFLPFGNRLEFFVELLAIWRLGACAVPIDSRLTPFEINTLVAAATPRLAVVDDATDPAVSQALTEAGVTVISTLDTGAEEATAGLSKLDDDALILFTSGSTGAPKGVVHTHRSLRARWMSLCDHLGVKPFARTLCLLPTHFGHGLICNCLFPWLSGQDLFITPPFRPEIIMRLGPLLDEHRITFMSSVPAVWRFALKLSRPPTAGTLERVHCGSAPLSAHVWEEIRTWTGTRQVCNAYGITETGSWVAGLSDADCPAEDGLVGEGWGAVIKVLHSSDTSIPLDANMECAPGEEGFVWLNTPALMKGYFQRDDLTRQAVTDGWFLTGDIGLIDEKGRLVLRGRERDEINKGGMKIYPADVDAVVERFEHASDVCTFALDDAIYGQTVGIAIVLTKRDDATIRALHQWMKVHLAEHKLPGRWWIVEEIPRTSRGKINRDAVNAACIDLTPLDLPGILAGEAKA